MSVGRLEAVYAGSSPLIHQMYIYGSGLRSYLLAVVIPSPGAATYTQTVTYLYLSTPSGVLLCMCPHCPHFMQSCPSGMEAAPADQGLT